MVDFRPRVRNSFSERNGFSSINKVIQKDDLDERTRNAIINEFDEMINYKSAPALELIYTFIYKNIFFVTKDEMPNYNERRREIIVIGIRENWNYDEIFSFLEAFAWWYNKQYPKENRFDEFNDLFERECVGYRFINGQVTDITSEEEIKEINEALNNKYSACKNSISKAIEHLYNRENPDYSNSVKESISAVEGMCNIIVGSNNSTLGKALDKLEENGVEIHSAMKKAYSALYGYTSDKSGIRHNSGLDENTTFEEAKYMLVSCSAFINYLTSLYEKNE